MVTNQSWILRNRPKGLLSRQDVELVARPLPPLEPGEVLVLQRYVSISPTNRIWMSDREQYMPPVEIGEVLRGGAVGEVVESRSGKFRAGDQVSVGFGGWELYSQVDEAAVRHLNLPIGVPQSAALSVLGGNGLTAYFGVLDIARPSAGETMVVTAAAGSVGSLAGQIAKRQGARVIGVCGSQEKCRWLVDELGFDGAINYKMDDAAARLDELCPNGIDCVFENVGGPFMDETLKRLNRFGRLAICGLIATYNREEPVIGPRHFERVLMKQITIRGFLVSEFFARSRECFDNLGRWITAGELKWKDHIVTGIENAPAALEMLFTGRNSGKVIVQTSFH